MAIDSCSSDSALPPPTTEMTPIEKVAISTIAKGGVATPFPYQLHIMLESMDAYATKGYNRGKSIVGWQRHGRAFKVHSVKQFVESIMPHFFNQTKYTSFQRQLNLYGFIRITVGRDKGAVYHPCFVRNQPQMIQGMVRKKVKGTKTRKVVLPESQPNFYADEKLRVIAAVDVAFDAPAMVNEETNKGVPSEAIRPILRKNYLSIETMSFPPPNEPMKLVLADGTQRHALLHHNHNSGEINLSFY